MYLNIGIILASIILSAILTGIVRKLLIKKNILDNPNERSSHTIPTPRGGGIAIVIVWFIGLVTLFITDSLENNLFYALLSGALLVVIGILDDIYDLKPIIRIIAQFTTVGLALFFLKGLQILDLGLVSIEINWLLTLLSFIGIIWFINLYNFLDGIDGYAGLQAVFISLAFFYFTSSNIYVILAGASIGFLIWNWQPAKIFMGDVGSTLLGFNFAILAIYEQNTSTVPIIVFLIISTLFWFDATFTLYRRFRNKEKLSQAHRKHAYQRIVQAGFSHQRTTLLGFLINLVLFGLAVLAVSFELYTLGFLVVAIVLLFVITRLIDKKKAFEK